MVRAWLRGKRSVGTILPDFQHRFQHCARSLVLKAGVMLGNTTSADSKFECAAVAPFEGSWGDGQPNDAGYPCVVESVQMSRVLLDELLASGGGLKTVLFKMDLEGSDHRVWDELVKSNVLCVLGEAGVHTTLVFDYDHVDDDVQIES
eukprot:TRINITY_DN5628_c0_g1_i1.p2 TRINITY_DN5628_c0_g1~~TRINITY_DN5628_c0_g1_i1.p2  ORF type:complete len:148 (+),score=13.74 TRINITY_DN5628_c0_g1_i1:426-869(+)